MAASSNNVGRKDRYPVSVQEYITYRNQGFLLVKGLVAPNEIAELIQHTEDLMQGRLPEQAAEGNQKLESPPANLSPDEKAQFFLRIHMLHRKVALHERYLLHPRVLDVVECLIGPDILALQTMLFLKPPGKPGQGWHQDSFYIPTHPDTLCGAWIAVDDADEFNGAMWMAVGSHHEPIYPPKDGIWYGDRSLSEIQYVGGASNPDDEKNDLTRVANKYPQVLLSAKAGDVVFFHSHILHRSKKNITTDRYRRAFVSHYCNARSFTQWGAHADATNPHAATCIDPVTKMTNASHILARGDTHLPFARPCFNTPCAALLPAKERRSMSEWATAMMGDMNKGKMDSTPANPNLKDDHSDEKKAVSAGY